MDSTTAEASSAKIAILDLETTGLDIHTDRIIQIACLTLNYKGTPENLYETYINPGKDAAKIYQSGSFKCHHISPDMLKDAPTFKEESQKILDLLQSVDLVVGHNITYDFDMLRGEFVRLDQRSSDLESESDEGWRGPSHISDNPGEITTRFDELKFKLVDTFRLALAAFPFARYYSLSALANFLQIQVFKYQEIGYKWQSSPNGEASEFKCSKKVEKMAEHNAITDILETEILFKKCLKVLGISSNDIINGKCCQFEVSKALILAVDKLLLKTPTDNELIEIAKIAPEQMNVNFPDRAKKLKDMSPSDIRQVVNFLGGRKYMSDKRQKLICQGFLHLVVDENALMAVNAKIVNEQQRLFPPLTMKDEERVPEVESKTEEFSVGEQSSVTALKSKAKLETRISADEKNEAVFEESSPGVEKTNVPVSTDAKTATKMNESKTSSVIEKIGEDICSPSKIRKLDGISIDIDHENTEKTIEYEVPMETESKDMNKTVTSDNISPISIGSSLSATDVDESFSESILAEEKCRKDEGCEKDDAQSTSEENSAMAPVEKDDTTPERGGGGKDEKERKRKIILSPVL
eukprot:Seg1666.5 transcript_id=Seg1666.5/GoldUCD/mRNA.D3Y31 product="DNA polymerase III subunit epsilon" protein_id=Seg1666.5/GoldUCD/D3Y31